MEFPLPYFSESGYELFYGHNGDAGLDLPLWDARLTDQYKKAVNDEYSEAYLEKLEKHISANSRDMEGASITLAPMESLTIKTGVYMKIPNGNFGFLDTRSSTSKIKLDLLCRTIDEPYTGNIRLALINLNEKPVTVKQGQCVAQIIIKPYTKVKPDEFLNLEKFLLHVGETTRGDKGFGSTGRNV